MKKDIKKFILNSISNHPRDVVKMVMNEFSITRAAVHKHLQKLIDEGIIGKEGKKNSVIYTLQNRQALKNSKKFYYQVGEKSESEIWQDDIRPFLGSIPSNIEEICQYGFTEMFNNIIDHSESTKALVSLEINNEKIKIEVIDYGIGIFKKVALACILLDYREAIVKIHQGKFTTDKTRHSGEGIFFTSRSFDHFTILSNSLMYHKSNTNIDDWYLESKKDFVQDGTSVLMEISLTSKSQIKEKFDQFTNPINYKFDKTQILVSLSKFEEDDFVSRSQAKRLLHGLDQFREIIFDFFKIKSVGQGFVDEVFGVFAINHPKIEFKIINANDDILFMLKRGIANREGMKNIIVFE